jgi:hypothetical protein
MTVNFHIELSGVNFDFNSMNRVRLHLFQIYVDHEGKRHRFHMEIEDDGNFHIKDKPACPAIYLPLESTMSDAIKKLGEVKVHVLH